MHAIDYNSTSKLKRTSGRWVSASFGKANQMHCHIANVTLCELYPGAEKPYPSMIANHMEASSGAHTRNQYHEYGFASLRASYHLPDFILPIEMTIWIQPSLQLPQHDQIRERRSRLSRQTRMELELAKRVQNCFWKAPFAIIQFANKAVPKTTFKARAFA